MDAGNGVSPYHAFPARLATFVYACSGNEFTTTYLEITMRFSLAGPLRLPALILLPAAVLMHAANVAYAADATDADSVKKSFAAVAADARVQQGLAFIKADEANTLAEQKTINVIAAPPFKERVRGEYYAKRFAELGLARVHIDSEGNVIGVRAGSGGAGAPRLVVAAHLDTVFPEGTDLTIHEKDGRIYSPGIGDDTRGLAALLSVIRALQAGNIKTAGEIIFVGDVGEEGLGDLRGMKALFRDDKAIDGFISIDGTDVTRVTYEATGSHRYEITYTGPGGHSFGAFGLPSAIHAMGRAIAKISDFSTPKDPKTTFTVGTVSGGTSVNAIAGLAKMEIDMRSNSNDTLFAIEKQVLAAARQGADEENARWNAKAADRIRADIKLVGDRPAGTQSKEQAMVQVSALATSAIGQLQKLDTPSSTDSNIPISLGIPAVTLGGGGKSGGAHSIGEWYDPSDSYLGPQKVFLTALGLVGIEGVAAPTLLKRTR
jgi:tripeptide aminopeptidase